MSKHKFFAALLATVLSTPVLAQKSNQSQILLESARQKETLEGDLKGAIRQYEEIVRKFSADRAVVATALVRMAEAHQKLGDSEAQKIFERVVRDYSDQKVPVDQARARLAVISPKPALAGVVNRVAWTVSDGGWIEGKISPDGRYVPYVHYKEGGNLFLRDLVSGTDRQLTNTGNDARQRAPGVEYECAHEYAFSRDGKQLAYSWDRGGTGGRYELRVVNLQGSGLPAFRRLFDNEELSWIMPHDWSPDGKSIAVSLTRKDNTAQIGLVSAENGSLKVLKSIDWRGPIAMYFSPDGQYLAYDLPAGETQLQRDILVLAVDGSREIPAEVHPSDDTFVGWAPDGKRLLFASDRSGSMDLWARQVSGGKPQGQPELLKRDIGRFDSMGITSSGSLHYAVAPPVGSFDIRTAELDFDKGEFISRPVQAVGTYVGNNFSPAWAPDGKHFAWVSRRGSRTTSHFVIGIRSPQTGQVRELMLPPNFYVLGGFSWGHDGNSFLVGGFDKGRSGLYRVDRDSGRTSLVVATKRGGLALESPDGSAIYYGGFEAREDAIVRRVLASGEESVLLKGNYRLRSLSRDGRYLAVDELELPPSRMPQAVFLVPTDGKAPRELSRTTQPQRTLFLAWLPDQQSVLIAKQAASGEFERLQAPVDGGQPKKLETKVQFITNFSVHPDERQILFQAPMPKKRPEVWILENFLPTLSASK